MGVSTYQPVSRLFASYFISSLVMGIWGQSIVTSALLVAASDEKFEYFAIKSFARPSYIAALMTAPMLFWLVAAEQFSFRKWWLHIIAGISSTSFVIAVYTYRELDGMFLEWQGTLAPFLKALPVPVVQLGIVTGLIGWLLSGRRAGTWKEYHSGIPFGLLFFPAGLVVTFICWMIIDRYVDFWFLEGYRVINIMVNCIFAGSVAAAVFGAYLEATNSSYSLKRNSSFMVAAAIISTSLLLTAGSKLWDYYPGPATYAYGYAALCAGSTAIVVAFTYWNLNKLFKRLV